MDCGPTCLRMIAKYYGKHYNADSIRQVAGFGKAGVSMLGISEAAEKMGFRTRGVKITFQQLVRDAQLPCILHWDQSHFVVLMPHSKWKRKNKLQVADPSKQIIGYNKAEFLDHWISSANNEGESVGTALLLEPTPDFFEASSEKEKKLNWQLVLQYLQQSRWKIMQVFIALIITSLLQLFFPYLTQSIVDTGINTQNLQYVTIILIAQLMLVFSRSVVDFIRTRLLMGISIIINLSILSDFWIKLTRLPLSYFDTHHTGDTLQRIGDNKQIQSFLTGSALSTLFSVFNFVVFAFVLIQYNLQLFFVFAIGSILYFLWIRFFLVIRRKLNYQIFHISAKENTATLQMVQGMQEIRLNSAEQLKRWEWENIQVGISKLQLKSLNYSQFQQAGALLINQGKDLLITFIVARLVIQGDLTFGAMLAVQYIIGQLSSPIEQFIGFMQTAQDAKISMERLNEIHEIKDEEDRNKPYINHLPENKSIEFSNVSFAYPGAGNEPVLDNIHLHIPQGKVTAIVGVSGSGKTTLLKLLLKFYDYYSGDIKIGETNFKHISPSFWRKQCGAVMQDGFIFNDSIACNIAVGEETLDYEKLITSCKIANILSFIDTMPNGFHSQLGANGVGISQGQKQRLLIARAIYKNPMYLFFDEATNSLDANNEKAIVENLKDFFRGRTVIIVAHRLSTVKNADKIIVLNKGKIVEEGTHLQLSANKGNYFELVQNQLELGD
ncbi:MAG: peptidase domain-containing ABC transporter [Bacteroidetes bacterium]|nr:peptidase domain-containing ABC transporter [Bacteroidota bacterium]